MYLRLYEGGKMSIKVGLQYVQYVCTRKMDYYTYHAKTHQSNRSCRTLMRLITVTTENTIPTVSMSAYAYRKKYSQIILSTTTVIAYY